jgi:hypothetical protein
VRTELLARDLTYLTPDPGTQTPADARLRFRQTLAQACSRFFTTRRREQKRSHSAERRACGEPSQLARPAAALAREPGPTRHIVPADLGTVRTGAVFTRLLRRELKTRRLDPCNAAPERESMSL